MDKDTRNRLQRATQAARALIEDEYGEQLEGTFDLRLDGTIPPEPGDHLDAHQRVLWKKLVAAIGHLEAGGEKKPEAVQAYLREAAFTTLNRFVALKMLEARGLVLGDASQGDQSSGFKEFTGLAPGLVQVPDRGYRLYVESLFDEIGREVRVLFDRRDPASLLWPRRQALQRLLEILNAPELSLVWVEDETIGWVYQYFNGEDERKAMREASQAPRSSRELAVRNQFFTPRYVVQFLVDNTLGRTWFEMMRGETSLKDLDYLVRHEHEVFLAENEAAPEEPKCVSLGQVPEHPFPVPFRAKKDPRDLRILDPACGSGHFLIYTFDLLLTIYEDAWHDKAAAPSKQSGTTLSTDYPDLEALRAAVPELILRHNLHGIDIDPRAAQIAALALWLRAQRAFQEAGVWRTQRPGITKTNIVVAEPMPGEAELLEEFTATLKAPLPKVVQSVFEHMTLAGEAGYLLRIAELMEESIRKVYGDVGGLFEKAEHHNWKRAAEDLRRALDKFATNAAAGQAFTRQLFAGEAARGLGFIDACSCRYDTILMNPPFGLMPRRLYDYLRIAYPSAYSDLAISFMARGHELLAPNGSLGAITNRNFLNVTDSEKFRRSVVMRHMPIMADLGAGVMDGAFVDASAQVLSAVRSQHLIVKDARQSTDRPGALKSFWSERDGEAVYRLSHAIFETVPKCRYTYDAGQGIGSLLAIESTIDPDWGIARTGASTFEDDRFLRLSWEVSPRDVGRDRTWCWSGRTAPDFTLYYHPYEVLAKWNSDGAELCERNRQVNGQTAQARQGSSHYFKPGIVFSRRSRPSIAFRVHPADCVFSSTCGVVFPADPGSAFFLIGVLNSSYIRSAVHTLTTYSYTVGHVRALLSPKPSKEQFDTISGLAKQLFLMKRRLFEDLETDHYYRPRVISDSSGSIRTLHSDLKTDNCKKAAKLEELQTSLDEEVASLYGLDSEADTGQFGIAPSDVRLPTRLVDVDLRTFTSDLIATAFGCAVGRWDAKHLTFTDAATEPQNCFGALPVCAPGMLTAEDGMPADAPPNGYPIFFPADGVLVDDPGSDRDSAASVRKVFDLCFEDPAARWEEAAEILGDRDRALRGWLARDFFELHIKRYSKSKRKAPIYWQLATPSASYSAWLYYHRCTRDTMFRLLNDLVVPKLQHEERRLTNLSQDAGPNPTAGQRKEIDDQETFVAELRAFRDEVARIAPLWNPNLNDGVILNFAPLWRLVPQHRTWQKECKSAWDKLREGHCDWAQLAMHLWPERVVPKCAEDRGLAIAHGLDAVFWREGEDGKWQQRAVPDDEVAALIAERTSPAVNASLKSLLGAPAPAAGRGRAPRRKKTTTRRVKSTVTSTVPAEPRERTSSRATSTHTVDNAVLDQIRSAIVTLGGDAAKSDILDTAGLPASQWTPAINALLADGSVKKTGQRRGTRYHLAQDPN